MSGIGGALQKAGRGKRWGRPQRSRIPKGYYKRARTLHRQRKTAIRYKARVLPTRPIVRPQRGNRIPKTYYRRARTPQQRRHNRAVIHAKLRGPKYERRYRAKRNVAPKGRIAPRTQAENQQILREALHPAKRSLLKQLLSGGADPSRAIRPPAKDVEVGPINVSDVLEGRSKALNDVTKTLDKLTRNPDTHGGQVSGLTLPGGVAENFRKELIELPASLIPSVYQTGASLREAAEGRPKRAKKLWKEYKRTGVIPALIDKGPGEAVKRFEERPLSGALELSGGKAIIGRSAGAALRAAPSKTLRRAASTKGRAPYNLYPHTAEGKPVSRTPQHTIERRYSRDVINKGIQVAADKAAAKRPNTLLRSAARNRRLRRDVDTEAFADVGVYRQQRGEVAGKTADILGGRREHAAGRRRSAKPAVSRGEREGFSHAVQAVSERIVRSPKTAQQDLRIRLAQLDKELPRAAERGKGFTGLNRREHAALSDLLEKGIPSSAFRAADRLKSLTESQQAKLGPQGYRIHSAQEQSRRWFPYLQTHHGLSGARLEEAAKILERRARRGKPTPVEPPVFISQRPVKSGGQGFFKASWRNPKAAPIARSKRRTGAAFQLGARETGREAITRQVVGAQGELSQAEGFFGKIKRYGLGKPEVAKTLGREPSGGKFYTVARQAENAADDLLEATGERFVVVNVAPPHWRSHQLEVARKEGRPAALETDVVHELSERLQQVFKPRPDDRGRFVLMPKEVADQLQRHTARSAPTSLGRGARSATSAWKDVTLLTQSPASWMAGNVADIGTRSILAGLNPAQTVRGMRLARAVEKMDARTGAEAGQVLHGGGFGATAGRVDIYNPSGMAARYPALKMPARAAKVAKDSVYAAEGALERLPTYAAVGKAAKEDIAFQRSWKGMLKLADEQIDDYARGLVPNVARRRRLQKSVEDVMGRWGKVSPTMRKTLAFSPFLQWPAAALRYVYITLPAHHPIKTGLGVAMERSTEEERKKLGLSQYAPDEKRVPGYQTVSIPLKNGKVLPVGKLGSFGVPARGLAQAPELLLPQVRPVLQALGGYDWKGDRIVYPRGHPKAGQDVSEGEREAIAFQLLVQSFVPFGGAAHRAVELGGRIPTTRSTLLRPEAEKKWNKRTEKLEEAKGSIERGAVDWAVPLKPSKRITNEKRQEYRDTATALRTLEKWRRKKKKKGGNPFSSGSSSKGNPFKGGSSSGDNPFKN